MKRWMGELKALPGAIREWWKDWWTRDESLDKAITDALRKAHGLPDHMAMDATPRQ